MIFLTFAHAFWSRMASRLSCLAPRETRHNQRQRLAVHVPSVFKQVDEPVMGHKPDLIRNNLERTAVGHEVLCTRLVSGCLDVDED